MYWTTLEISAPRCALMCYPSSNITYCIACLLCIGVILLNKFNSIQFNSICDSGSSVKAIPPSFPSRCCYSSCSCPSSIAMGEHLLVYIFTMEILFFGNPYCLIEMVYCKDGGQCLARFLHYSGDFCSWSARVNSVANACILILIKNECGS